MSADYSYWTNALAGKFGPVHDGDAQAGFYRRRQFKNGPFVPVAIWLGDDGKMLAKVGNDMADAAEVWSWVCDKPITHDRYVAVMAGEGWGDVDATVETQVGDDRRNSDPTDESQIVKDQVASAKAGADAYAKITSDEELPKAQSLRSRLLELKSEAEKKHKAEKEPHLKAGREVDAKWLPTAKEAEAAANGIRKSMEAYETEKMRVRREEERKQEAARLAAEEEARKATEAGKPAKPVFVPPAPEPVATMPAPIKGSYGRAASVGVVNVVTAITDQAALYEFLKDHPDLKNCMFDLAKRAVAKGHTVPGVSVEEQAKVA